MIPCWPNDLSRCFNNRFASEQNLARLQLLDVSRTKLPHLT